MLKYDLEYPLERSNLLRTLQDPHGLFHIFQFSLIDLHLLGIQLSLNHVTVNQPSGYFLNRRNFEKSFESLLTKSKMGVKSHFHKSFKQIDLILDSSTPSQNFRLLNRNSRISLNQMKNFNERLSQNEPFLSITHPKKLLKIHLQYCKIKFSRPNYKISTYRVCSFIRF